MARIKVERLNAEQKQQLRIPPLPHAEGEWFLWECERSEFDWHYSQLEKAYVYEGLVKVKTSDGEVEIRAGDFVTFPKGLDCRWKIIEPIRKVYKFE